MPRVTWITPYADLWIKAYGGEPAYKVLAKYMRPLEKTHGNQVVIRHWARYIAETEARFASPARFSQTFGSWKPEPERRLMVLR